MILFPHLGPELNETVYLMAAVAAACAVPGVFLVLRRMVLVGDAISHVLLLGIVLAYFVVKDAASPLLFFGAAAVGVLTVALVEGLQRTKLLKEDAAIGLVFPFLFSLGTLLASMYLRNTHLDVDRVLLGSAELAFRDRLTVGGRDLGPRAFVLLGGTFVVFVLLIALFYKELKLCTFDPGLAAVLGFLPAVVHYALMTSVSLATVAAFDAVGPVLVLAFFAVPPVMARLLTKRLVWMLVLSVILAVTAAVTGTLLAIELDITIAGTVAGVLGAMFAVVYLFAPRAGVLAEMIRRVRMWREFHETLLTVHLHRHAGTPAEAEESRVDGLHEHLNWTEPQTAAVVRRAVANGLMVRAGDCWKLTDTGRKRAEEIVGPRLGERGASAP
ncbi:metal ABC transporter permease [Limnoglobus roseus]|uniref:Metal ABC transporter permease n=1 Tax=Limnoglobus roseus TaxID=2598579 RepID=A0A5C1APM9_9BACT|nr:metal ABC transporter permease [Limnoglobus roseus]QEL19702.1 metal ABC transporter permease [Limnoglobus roseus]